MGGVFKNPQGREVKGKGDDLGTQFLARAERTSGHPIVVQSFRSDAPQIKTLRKVHQDLDLDTHTHTVHKPFFERQT